MENGLKIISKLQKQITHSNDIHRHIADTFSQGKYLEFAMLQEWYVVSERNLNQMHLEDDSLGLMQQFMHVGQLFEAASCYVVSGMEAYAKGLIQQTEAFHLLKLRQKETVLPPVLIALAYEMCGDLWSLNDQHKSIIYYEQAETFFQITDDIVAEMGKWSNLAVSFGMSAIRSGWSVILNEPGIRHLPDLWQERKPVKLALLNELQVKMHQIMG